MSLLFLGENEFCLSFQHPKASQKDVSPNQAQAPMKFLQPGRVLSWNKVLCSPKAKSSLSMSEIVLCLAKIGQNSLKTAHDFMDNSIMTRRY